MNENLKAEKWRKLLKHCRYFRRIPFIDFVLVAGSMAMDEAHEKSDFDVIIGVKEGRIWTVRMFSVVLFGLLGIRRKNSYEKSQSSDKICFNHFVAPKGYTLAPPYNEYWKELYCRLAPVYGRDKKAIERFFKANSWAGSIDFRVDRISESKRSFSGVLFEFILGGKFGNLLEKFFKKVQITKIEKSIKIGALGHRPILIYNDDELRFHVDTKRTEEWINKKRNKPN